MSEIRERFDFQAALERARKVLSNPNAVVECVPGVSIHGQEAANSLLRVAGAVRRRRVAGAGCAEDAGRLTEQ
jgi:hypothetical protein